MRGTGLAVIGTTASQTTSSVFAPPVSERPRLLNTCQPQVRLPYASARVVQDTLVLDRDSKSEAEAGFRNNSALLPKGERVEYTNTFKKENGKWKLYLIISDMKPVVSKQAEKAAE